MTGTKPDDTVQKIQYFMKLIKFKNRNEDNEVVSFVPHHLGNRNTKSVVEVTTESDSGNRFAYDTVNNNEEFDFAGNNVSISGQQKNNYDVVERSSPEPKANIINVNNEKQEATTSFDVIKDTTESSLRDISNSSDVDMEINSQTNSMTSKNETKNTSAEKTLRDYEIQRFISEHIKYKSNNVTIKKSWGKWTSWSSCSRSCGEGVMSQRRECMEKT
jgi:hypothetical protein